MIPSRDVDAYYPPAESQGGWRYLETKEDVYSLAGIDLAKLEQLFELQDFLFGGYLE